MKSNVKIETLDQSPRGVWPRTFWWGSAASMAIIAIQALNSSDAADGTNPPTPAAVRSSSAFTPEESPSGPNDRWLDHSVVNVHSTAHASDLPGASIAEWGP